MVDADLARGAPDLLSGPDDMAFVDAPPRERRLKRPPPSTPKKQDTGGFMGIFGSLRKPTRPEMPDRRKSRSYRDEEARHLTEPERDDRRVRRDRDRDDRRRRSVKPDTDAEGFTTDAAGVAAGGETEPEDAEARRAARRAKRTSRQAPSETREAEAREAEAREAEERRARRKEKIREREAREQRAREEEEQRREEERRVRRAAREERRAREEQAARDAAAAEEAKAAERRERRRLRDEEMAAKAKRRRSRADEPPVDGYAPDDQPDGRRGSRTTDDKARRRKSKAMPAPEQTRAPLMTGGLNHGNTGGPKKDKISTWVYSQAEEPPEPPPIMPTVIDMPPDAAAAAENAHSLSSDEEARRVARRRARQRAKYGDMPDREVIDDVRSRRRESRREGVKSSSGSGDYERDRGMRSQHGSRHGGAPAPPSSGAKKSSWFKKLTSF